jgi:histidinol dehydrogenase
MSEKVDITEVVERVLGRIRAGEQPARVHDMPKRPLGVFGTVDDAIGAAHKAQLQLIALPMEKRREIIAKSLNDRGALILTRSMEEACAISNRIAPEHLEVSSRDPQRWEPLLRHAGAIFLGAYTSESLGDYCAGPNHVLPTSGTARFSSPLGVYDFQKRSSLIEVSEAGAQVLGPVAAELAYGEGLQAHARAAEFRLHKVPPMREKS